MIIILLLGKMTTSAPDARGRTPNKKKRRSTGQTQVLEGSGEKDAGRVVAVPVRSPAGPLQGGARVIKDHCADWHNYMEKWDSLNDKGLAVVNRIVTAKLQADYSESSEVATMTDKGVDVESNSQGIMGTQMPDGLEDLCDELTGVYKSLEKLVNKMTAITKHLQGVRDMEKSFSGSEELQPLFQTWPVQLFWETSSRLEGMFRKELALKKAITEDVAHSSSRDVLMTYTSAWLHQPYLDDEVRVLLESMLKETGHR